MHVCPCIVQFGKAPAVFYFSIEYIVRRKARNFSHRPLFVKFTLFAFRTALIDSFDIGLCLITQAVFVILSVNRGFLSDLLELAC